MRRLMRNYKTQYLISRNTVSESARPIHIEVNTHFPFAARRKEGGAVCLHDVAPANSATNSPLT